MTQGENEAWESYGDAEQMLGSLQITESPLARFNPLILREVRSRISAINAPSALLTEFIDAPRHEIWSRAAR